MKLTIYTDESMTAVREVREVPRMKIPYKTSIHVAKLMGDVDMDNMSNEAVFGMVLQNERHLTAVVRATFGLAEEDLDYIDVVELGDLARDIVAWVVQKMAELGIGQGGETSPNPQAQAQTTA